MLNWIKSKLNIKDSKDLRIEELEYQLKQMTTNFEVSSKGWSQCERRCSRQSKELNRLQSINAARKEVIKQMARTRDDFYQFVLYVNGVLDAYGHKMTLGFDFKTLFEQPSIQQVVKELNEGKTSGKPNLKPELVPWSLD